MSDEVAVREQGSVKWFNEAKGFGFIISGAGEDVFVHYSSIQSKGFKTLKQDAVVEFVKIKTPKGFQAKDVEVVRS